MSSAAPQAPEPSTLTLHGLRVVEYAEGIAGPYAARLLADPGAEVITELASLHASGVLE